VRRACRGFRGLRDRPAPKDRRGRKVRLETKATKGKRAASISALFRLMAQ
jgi:hypothetical protein